MRETRRVKMAYFAIASLKDSCKYAKAPQGAKLFLVFNNLASSSWLLASGSSCKYYLSSKNMTWARMRKAKRAKKSIPG